MGKFRKTINIIFVIALLSGIGYCTNNFVTAESRVRALCDELQPGMTVAALREFASQHGLSSQIKDSGTSFMVETKTYGRYGCEITTESGIVKRAEYNSAD